MKSKTYLAIILMLGAAVVTSSAAPPSKTNYRAFKEQKERRQEQLQMEDAKAADARRTPTIALNVGEQKGKSQPRAYHFQHKTGLKSR